ncbi:MAG TPA: hypothetical protein VEY88_08840, partial [Archangium sp.]|nr:hypothetical protein [Archangium sp.]
MAGPSVVTSQEGASSVLPPCRGASVAQPVESSTAPSSARKRDKQVTFIRMSGSDAAHGVGLVGRL